jgi:hypothetical protein
MIFAFLEDGTLEVHEDLASVQREFEGVDVENEVVHFYNEQGVYLEPEFIVPNRSGKLLGLFGWVASGVFQLIPNANAGRDSFALALHETSSLAPNRWFGSLEQLKSELLAKGVVVSFEHPGRNAV